MYHRYRINSITAIMMLLLAGKTVADSSDDGYIEFNPAFMSRGSQQQIDLQRYGYNLPPVGTYRAYIVVNGYPIGSDDVIIQDRAATGENAPKKVDICVKNSTLNLMQINYEKLSREALDKIKDAGADACIPLEDVLQEGRVTFDSNELTLNVDVPQAMLVSRARGYVNPAVWDKGITAATLGYNLNFNRNHSHGKDYDSFFTGLNAGFNFMGWYFRHNGNYNWQNQDGSDNRYTTLNSYVQRDIPEIEGRLIFGDANTRGELFDTIAFRGVQLANEEQMLPDSLRGYAPAVRGTARTAARVIIRQNGNVIYEKTVPPGPFEILDLYPTGYGGNLDVTIEEADGSSQNFQIPYASTTNLLRPGTQHYSVTYGKLRYRTLDDEPMVGEATYRRGITNEFTLYAGTQLSSDYQAVQGGGAVGTFIGAFSLDVTHSNVSLDDAAHNLKGQSYQAKYSQNILSTGSNFSLAAYRFSTDGYMDLMTSVLTRDAIKKGFGRDSILRPKSRLTISANQQLPEGYGQFYVSAYSQNYWNDSGKDRSYQIGYNNLFKGVSYGISATRNRNGYGDFENMYMLNFTIPLNRWSGLTQVGVNVNRGPGSTMTEQLYVTGLAGNEDQISYGLTASHANKGGGTSGSFNGSLRTPYTTVQGIVGAGSGYELYSAGLSGSMVAHSGGLTLSPYIGDTYALVEAKGAEGASVSGYSGIQVDRWGYALVPYLTAYQMNEIEINPKGLSNNVELNLTSQKVAPYSGAVVKVDYGTTVGYPILISSNQANGNPLPFGADVYDMQNNRVGVVGQGGRLFARVPSDSGRLKVSWGDNESQRCYVTYLLPKDADLAKQNIVKFTSVCQP